MRCNRILLLYMVIATTVGAAAFGQEAIVVDSGILPPAPANNVMATNHRYADGGVIDVSRDKSPDDPSGVTGHIIYRARGDESFDSIVAVQISAMFLPLPVNWQRFGHFFSNLSLSASGQVVNMAGNILVVPGVFCGIEYFFFSKEHKGDSWRRIPERGPGFDDHFRCVIRVHRQGTRFAVSGTNDLPAGRPAGLYFGITDLIYT